MQRRLDSSLPLDASEHEPIRPTAKPLERLGDFSSEVPHAKSWLAEQSMLR